MTAHHTESLQILGIDAAVDPRNTGLAIARFAGRRWRIDSLETGRKETPIAEQVLPLLNPSSPVLVAIDAPMGWPMAFLRNVSVHQAGEKLDSDSRLLFARETDRVVHRETGLTPCRTSSLLRLALKWSTKCAGMPRSIRRIRPAAAPESTPTTPETKALRSLLRQPGSLIHNRA